MLTPVSERRITRRTDANRHPARPDRTALRSLLLILLVLMTPAIGLAQSLDPSRIQWSELRLYASKFFVSIEPQVALSSVPSQNLDVLLMAPGEGQAVAPAGPTKELVFQTDAFSLKTRAALLLNADSGASLQRTSHDTGKRFRHRIYRYTDIGPYNRTRWPVGDAEEKLPTDQWQQWSEAGEGLSPYPESVIGKLVTDPGGLLYIIGAAPLDNPGDTYEIFAYVRRHVHKVHIEVAGMEDIKVDYKQTGGAAPGKKKGKQRALKLLLRGEGVDDGDSDNEFEMLGLRGDINIHIDPETRAPLQLEGRVKIAGHTVMRLTHLTVDHE